MPVVNVEINANQDTVGQPILWRLGKLYNVVTNVRRARVTEDYGYVLLEIEGSTQEIDQATDYLRQLGVLKEPSQGQAEETSGASASTQQPENSIPQPNTIYVRLTTANTEQGHVPVLYRIGKDFNVVVNLERAAFDEEEGGSLEINISGVLNNVQRSIAYLHTTGLHIYPRQRSVTDYSNL